MPTNFNNFAQIAASFFAAAANKSIYIYFKYYNLSI